MNLSQHLETSLHTTSPSTLSHAKGGAPMEKHIKMVANSAFRYFAHVKQNPSAKQEQDDHH
jgi:hypothetical protein